MRAAVLALTALVLPACSVVSAVDGRFSDGDKFYGEAVGHFSGVGVISLASESGLACEGDYDPYSRSRELVILMLCNDGQSALAYVQRDRSLQSGRGIFEMSEGRRGTFTFSAES